MSAYSLEKDFDSRLHFTDVSASSPYHTGTYSPSQGIPSSYDDRSSSYVKSHDSSRKPLDARRTQHDSPTTRQPLDHSIRSQQNYSRESYDASSGSPYQSQPGSRYSETSSLSSFQKSPPQDYPSPEYASINKQNMSGPRTSDHFEVRVTPLSSKAGFIQQQQQPGPIDTSRGPNWGSREHSASPTNIVSSPYAGDRAYPYGSGSPTRVTPQYPHQTRSPISGTYQEHSGVSYNPPGSNHDSNQFPEAAQSRLVYTGPPANYGYAQSRPMSSGSPPPPPMPSTGSQVNYSKQVYRTEMPPRSVNTPSPPLPPPPPPQDQQHSPPHQPLPPQTKLLYGPPPTTQQSSDYRNPRPFQHPSQPVQEPGSTGKEAEVDALTSLLMQNMEAAADPDFFGTCADCGKAVIGETNACSALDNIFHLKCFKCEDCGMCAKCARSIMGEDTGCKALDQLFHVDCFTCISCSSHLKGRPFYAMEGRPYCETCYINTLEKCSVCMEPITDRIVRATGKPYHSKCFVCVVCSKSLEGIPFTVDSSSNIHCIEDFHRKFAPRCCVCEEPIMPREGEEEAVRIVALDRSFHLECYKCEDCGMVLSSESEGRGCYPLDQHILCKGCNARRIQQLTTKMTTEL